MVVVPLRGTQACSSSSTTSTFFPVGPLVQALEEARVQVWWDVPGDDNEDPHQAAGQARHGSAPRDAEQLEIGVDPAVG